MAEDGRPTVVVDDGGMRPLAAKRSIIATSGGIPRLRPRAANDNDDNRGRAARALAGLLRYSRQAERPQTAEPVVGAPGLLLALRKARTRDAFGKRCRQRRCPRRCGKGGHANRARSWTLECRHGGGARNGEARHMRMPSREDDMPPNIYIVTSARISV